MSVRDVAVVVVAAGKGERLGADAPKAFVQLAGSHLLAHTLKQISKMPSLAHLVVVAPESHLADAGAAVAEAGLGATAQVVIGGATRHESVSKAMDVLPAATAIVLVHDAARALASTELFERVATSVRDTGIATVPVLPIVDTVKRVEGEQVLETVDRSFLGAAQTPQGFQAHELLAAYQSTNDQFTDDAALFQSVGGSVRRVLGDERAFKITTPHDLASAERLLAAETASRDLRVGIGIDVHRFSSDASKPLWLGGLEWPGEVGLDGHSDGDAIAHAIVDALLSAAGLGDIGSNFGVDRPEYAGASGQVFLNGTLELLADQGWAVNNVAVEIVGNRPKLSPKRAEVEALLSNLLGAPVTLAATTTDGLGFLGHSEGLAAVANASIYRIGRLAS